MVMLGGATGSLTRYVVGTAIMNRMGGRFPLGTVFINVTGSFLIGFIMTLLTERLSPIRTGVPPGGRFLAAIPRSQASNGKLWGWCGMAAGGWGLSTRQAAWYWGIFQFCWVRCSPVNGKPHEGGVHALEGNRKKVTIYLNEDTQHHLGSLYESILTFLSTRVLRAQR